MINRNFCAYHAKGEWAFVEDEQHDEDRRKFDNDFVNIFEDQNFDTLKQQYFQNEIQENFQKIIKEYENGLQVILQDETVNSQNCAALLVELFGEDFRNIRIKVLDLIIDVKEFIEKQIDMFFLYKCQNIYFAHPKFHNCKILKNKLKNQLMFQNFFEFGYKNDILDILSENFITDEFQKLIHVKINTIKIQWKLFINTLQFSQDFFIEDIKEQISEKFGKGIDVEVTVNLGKKRV